jgi:uncharacterized coiled-coil protein SlyX
MERSAQAHIERLESHLAHLEKQYDELNQVVIDQSRELTRLRVQLQRITSTVDNFELDRIKTTNPKPPHAAI